MFLVVLLYALFASVFTVGKTCLMISSPFFFVGTRMLTAGVILMVWQLIKDRSSFRINWKQLLGVVSLAFFAIYLTNVLESWGLKHLTSFKTCFIYSISPFATALFAYFLLKERMTSRKWLGLLVGFIGLSPVLLSQTGDESLTGELFGFSWASLAVLGAALASVYGWILLRKLINQGVKTPIANGMSMFIGGAIALVHSLFTEAWDPVPVTNVPTFLSCTLVLIVVSNLVCYNLYGHLLKRYTATFMSFAGFTTPLFTALFGWLFLGEMVNWTFYVSLVIVFSGLLIYHSQEIRSGEVKIAAQ